MRRFQAPTLETERLRFRAFRRSDIDDYAALHADPEVMRYVGGTWDRDRASRHLAFVIGHWPLWGESLQGRSNFLGRGQHLVYRIDRPGWLQAPGLRRAARGGRAPMPDRFSSSPSLRPAG